MARRKSTLLGSKRNTTDNALLMTVGFLGGLGTDAFYSSLRLPGYNSNIPSCNQLTFGDMLQLMIFGSLTFIGVLYTRRNLANFAFGLFAGKLFPSVFTASFSEYGVPRYLLFDIDQSTGNIVPKFNITETLGGIADGLGSINSQADKIGDQINKNLTGQLRNIPGLNLEKKAGLARAYATQLIGASPIDRDYEVYS